ncbi:MAG: HAD family hydrolase [Burkholderiales bacterium]
MSLEALLFRFDGAMADTEDARRQAFNAAFDALGLAWGWSPQTYAGLLAIPGVEERLHRYSGMLDLEAGELDRLHALAPEICRCASRLYERALADGRVPLRPGVKRLFKEALEAGLRVGVVITTAPAHAQAMLTAHLGRRGRAAIAACVAADQVAPPRLARDLYLKAIAELRVPADDALAVEESEIGLLAARGAGLVTVLTPTRWTAGQDFAGAHLRLSGLGEPFAPLPEPDARLAGGPQIGVEQLRRIHEDATRARFSQTGATV